MRLAIVLLVVLGGCKQNPSKLDDVTAPKPKVMGDAATGPATLADDLEVIRAKLKLPAIGAAAWRDGKLLDIAAVGVRKEGDPTKVTTRRTCGTSARTRRR
jgi:hypothetical protein